MWRDRQASCGRRYAGAADRRRGGSRAGCSVASVMWGGEGREFACNCIESMPAAQPLQPLMQCLASCCLLHLPPAAPWCRGGRCGTTESCRLCGTGAFQKLNACCWYSDQAHCVFLCRCCQQRCPSLPPQLPALHLLTPGFSRPRCRDSHIFVRVQARVVAPVIIAVVLSRSAAV